MVRHTTLARKPAWLVSAYRIVAFLNRYRLHVIVAFMSTVWVLYVAWRFPLQSMVVPLISYTLLFLAWYLINRYQDYEEDRISQGPDAVKTTTILYISAAAFLGGAVLLIAAGVPFLPYLALAVLMYAYGAHIPIGGRIRKIKHLFFFKNIYAALVWHLAYIAVLMAHTGGGFFPHLYFHTLHVFFIMVMVEMLWDVRDVEGDRVVGARTVPNTLGLTPTKCIMGGSLLISLTLLHLYYWNWLMLAELLFLFVLALRASPQRSSGFFHLPVYAIILFNSAMALTI